MLEMSEASQNFRKFLNFSNEGHAPPILRGERGRAAAAPQPRPRRGRGRAAAAPRTPLKVAAARPAFEPRRTFLDCGAAATIRTFFRRFREFSGGPVAIFAELLLV